MHVPSNTFSTFFRFAWQPHSIGFQTKYFCWCCCLPLFSFFCPFQKWLRRIVNNIASFLFSESYWKYSMKSLSEVRWLYPKERTEDELFFSCYQLYIWFQIFYLHTASKRQRTKTRLETNSSISPSSNGNPLDFPLWIRIWNRLKYEWFIIQIARSLGKKKPEWIRFRYRRAYNGEDTLTSHLTHRKNMFSLFPVKCI